MTYRDKEIANEWIAEISSIYYDKSQNYRTVL